MPEDETTITEYFVNITNERLQGMSNAICIKLTHEDDNGEVMDNIAIVSSDRYQQFTDRLDFIQNNAHDWIDEQIADTITALTTGTYNIPYSVSSGKLLKKTTGDEISYDAVESAVSLSEKIPLLELNLNDLTSNVSLIDNNLTSLIDNLSTYAKKSDVQNESNTLRDLISNKSDNGHNHDDTYYKKGEVDTKLNAKANSSHNHTGWTYLKINDYSSLYYNTQLKLVQFRYYRADYKFKDTSAVKVATIPTAYRPKVSGPLPCYSTKIGCHVNTDGVVNVYTDSAGTRSINVRGMWMI